MSRTFRRQRDRDGFDEPQQKRAGYRKQKAHKLTPPEKIISNAHRQPTDISLFVTNHCLDRFRVRIAPHLADRTPKELRHLILAQIETGVDATAEQINLIRSSRATIVGGRHAVRRCEWTRIVLNDYVAYVVEKSIGYGPIVVTCYECEYLKNGEPGKMAEPSEPAKPLAADEWPWEWEPVESLLASDPYADLLFAFRQGDDIRAGKGTYKAELTGAPGMLAAGSNGPLVSRILYRGQHTKSKWRPISEVARETFAIVPHGDEARKSRRIERKGKESERRKQARLKEAG